mgnify:CR=1 FL=1
MMFTYTFYHSMRIFAFDHEKDALRKLVLVGILTIGTVLMETMDETVIREFEEFTDANSKRQKIGQGFSQVTSDDLDDRD